MSLDEAIKFRNLVQKANFKYQALFENNQKSNQQIEIITCESMNFKQESIDEFEEFNKSEIQQDCDNEQQQLNLKCETVENFQEIDIHHVLDSNSQPSAPTIPFKHPSQAKQTSVSDKNPPHALKRPHKNYNCNQCNASFPDDLEKQEHIIAVHKNSRKQSHKTLGCAQCSEKFFNDYERQAHVLKFHGKKSRKESHKTFYCIHCEEKFCSDFERLEHIGKTKILFSLNFKLYIFR